MSLRLTLSIIFSLAMSCTHSAELEHDFQSEIAEVEAHGSLLYEKVKSKEKFKIKDLHNYSDLKDWLSKVKCREFNYKPYLVSHGGEQLIYFVASKRFSKPVIIGRHFTMRIESNIAQVDV